MERVGQSRPFKAGYGRDDAVGGELAIYGPSGSIPAIHGRERIPKRPEPPMLVMPAEEGMGTPWAERHAAKSSFGLAIHAHP